MSDDTTYEDERHDDDARLRDLAADYHRPPATPREEMWAGLQARIAAESAGAGQTPAAAEAVVVPIESARTRRRWSLPWLGTAAAAAMIAIGFALGRFTGPRFGGPAAAPAAVAVAAPSGGDDAFRMAATLHLERSEELLTLVRSDAHAGHVDRAVGEWGESLLMETRLLLDSPAGVDPQLRPVLEDLELLLAQVALLSHGGGEGVRGREELRLIAEGMDAQDMLPRIQAVLPARAGS